MILALLLAVSSLAPRLAAEVTPLATSAKPEALAQAAFWGSYSDKSDRLIIIARWPDDPSKMAIYDSRTREFAPLEMSKGGYCTEACATKISFSRKGDRIVALVTHAGRAIAFSRNPIAISDMAFDYKQARMAGRLWAPTTPGRHPAVLLIGGTGKNRRDDFRIYPYLLVKAGYAVYAFDTDGTEEGIKQLAASNLAAIAAIRRLPKVDPTQVGILGISHGSWVAVEAAHEDPGVAFIIPIVGGGVPLWRATLFETHERLIGKEYSNDNVRAGDTLMAETFDALRDEKASVVPQLIKAAAAKIWFKDTPLAPFAGLPDGEVADIARERWATELSYNPASALAAFSIPILAISSDKDKAVPGPENLAEITRATNGRADTLLLHNADHFQSLVGVPNFVYADDLQAKLEAWLAARNRRKLGRLDLRYR